MRRLMRFFFHHLYHTFAFTYDWVAAIVSLGRWQHWAQAALPHITGRVVLELGPGPGHLQVALNKMGYRCLALEESHQMSRKTRQRLLLGELPTNVVRGIAQCLPLAAESVNTVVATFPSEYILAPETLEEAWRVLQPGGRLVVVPLAWPGGNSLIEKATRLLFRITGQGKDLTEPVLEAVKGIFTASRFEVRLLQENIQHSLVLVVLCEKPVE